MHIVCDLRALRDVRWRILLDSAQKVVYGARDEKRGFLTKAPNVLHPKTECIGGLLSAECGQLITDFFASKRQLK